MFNPALSGATGRELVHARGQPQLTAEDTNFDEFSKNGAGTAYGGRHTDCGEQCQGEVIMVLPVSVAAVLITGSLATAGAVAVADERNGLEVASWSVVDAPSVNLDPGDAGQASWSQRRAQRDGDDDSDSERRRGGVGRRDDEDSEGRRGRVANRDRGRDNNRFPKGRDTGIGGIAFDHGSNDGYDRGLQDGRDRNQRDPARHRDYRSADRGYDSRLGSREQYRIAYRDGFRDGYERGYRDGEGSGRSRTGRIRWPWPF